MSNPTGNALLHAQPTLREVTERIVHGLDTLPAGTFEVDARGTGLMLRKPSGRMCRPVKLDMAAIAEVLNAARALRPEGGVR